MKYLLLSQPKSIATLPSFGPIEGHKRFFQISSQWESQKNCLQLSLLAKSSFYLPAFEISRSFRTASDSVLFCRFTNGGDVGNNCQPTLLLFKGTQAWDIFEIFFLPKSNPYMPLVNFRKKFRLVSFDFRQNFKVWTFTRWLSIRGTKYFLRDIPKFFSSKSSLWSY